ncbi:FAD-linked reductase, partial [Heliocybe sulcata]
TLIFDFLAFVRPAKDELDALEKLGNPGWSWDTTIKYMRNSEHFDPVPFSSEDAGCYCPHRPSIYALKGPIAKSFPPLVTKLHPVVLDTLSNIGLPHNPDNSQCAPVGTLLVPTSVDSKTSTRSYAASAYFAPNASRPNFLVLTEAYATKIRLEKMAGGAYRSTGVEFTKDNSSAITGAKKEVILAAGSFQTPQLLELSGIGRQDILQSLGLPCLIDLPGGGENLQDHSLTPTIMELSKEVESIEVLYSDEGLKAQQELYGQATGILAGIPSATFAFIPGKVFGSNQDLKKWEDLCKIDGSAPEVFSNTPTSVKKGIQKQYEIMRGWIDNENHPLGQLLNINSHLPIPGLTVDPSKRYTTFLCAYTHPLSRGNVHCASADPKAPPAIQQNYLSNPADLDILAKILSFMCRAYRTPPLADWISKAVIPPFAGDERIDPEALGEYVRSTLSMVHHPVGMAAMLPIEDGGVVDSRLLVYGTTNLRVVRPTAQCVDSIPDKSAHVDCSIIPLVSTC